MKRIATVVAALVGITTAFPAMEELKSHLGQRQAAPELIGDLKTVSDGQLSQTGRDIKSILSGSASGLDTSSSASDVPAKESPECAEDPCCIWKHISDDMRGTFVDPDGQCNDKAREAIRLGFHDAFGWSKSTNPGGGADGSIVLAGECESRGADVDLGDICAQMRTWHDLYQQFGVSMADLIQMGTNVATVSCPLGPRVRSFVGRKDSSQPSPRSDLPSPADSADSLISQFADRTFTPANLVALLGAHSTGRQRAIDTSRAGDAFDTTPGVMDTNFFGETLDPNAPKQVFKLQSDINVSKDPRTSRVWTSFVGAQGQSAWMGQYATAYVRMSLLGVDNINNLTECTRVLPPFIGSFNGTKTAP
ncbi:ligninase H2 precursor [Ophiocordyceps camponoti-floridani]|uniref:Peroxidase n=1 Tax=Ophiocordyceps camponoti-floridani TaxID=2030778 RepID=A0A8H4Q0M2_9HYPO|nr:ligninase H2 precursor [Ophiocordyceps camponoti-floridani]